MRWPRCELVLVLALAAPVAAQRTWIVDAANGPGTHFTDFPIAVEEAAVGDTILIRPGDYTATRVSKGLTIVGDTTPPVFSRPVGPPIVVSGLPEAESVVMSNLEAHVSCTENQGRVHLQGVSWSLPSGDVMDIIRCRYVSLSGCTFVGDSVKVYQSHLIAFDCAFQPGFFTSITPMLAAINASLILVDCQVEGYDGWCACGLGCYEEPPTDAVSMTASTVLVTGANARIEGGVNQCSAACDFGGTGTVTFNTGFLQGFRVCGPFASTRHVPLLVGTPALPGEQMSWSLISRAGGSAGFMISLPGTRRVTPWGDLWIDPETHVLFHTETIPASGQLDVTALVPTIYPRGIPFLFQAGVISPSGLE